MPSYTHRNAAIAAALLTFVACSQTESIGKYPPLDGNVGGPEDVPGASEDLPKAGEDVSRASDLVSSLRDVAGDVAALPFCLAFGQQCAMGADCCSELCDPNTGTCVASINKCTPSGGNCQTSTECCSLVCTAGRCSASACIADNQACVDSASCCGGNCSAGRCQPLSTACHTAGNPCTANSQCCSSLCQAGVCKLGASFCIQTGDVCSDSGTCCSGDCQKGSGTLGTCAAPPSGATNCSDGVDGTVCGDCNGCCSRLCAPYAPTGVRVCQPASGCRVNGDLCRRDSDCCGAAGTGLPGDGNVVCQIDSGKALGICRNPRSCSPQGDVCHFKNYTCGVSSSRNNCCDGVGNSGVCQLDPLGVPRCNGLGTTCRPGGETCASAMDCCNQMPCVPDGAGLLRCYAPPVSTRDGGVPSSCVLAGGPCSITADCCVGSTCLQSVGSTLGICGSREPPPVSPPSTDAGPVDASTTICAEYGQTCTSEADCCNGITCWNGKCMDQVVY